MLQAGIEAAKSIEADKLRPALETAAVDSIKGHVAMRACDHQAVQGGYIVKVEKLPEGSNTCRIPRPILATRSHQPAGR